jgi:dolichyl-phosphate-mannose--protein O-mannosyl transferase
MPSVAFGFFACAFGLDYALSHPQRCWRLAGVAALAAIVAAFIFWLPLALGLPISNEGFYSRMWFNSWI